MKVIGEKLPKKITLTMQREYFVTGHISCQELEKRDRKLNWPIQVVRLDGTPFIENNDSPKDASMQFFLPPGKFELESYSLVVLLEFLGYWCGPCVRRGLPQMFAIQEGYRDKPTKS